MNLARGEMLERLIEAQYDDMDWEDLYRFFEYYKQREFAEWTTEEIEAEYNETFEED
jgi:hypothetical protein